MASSKEFRLIKKCQKLCQDITEMQATADKNYRHTICYDLRKKSEEVIFLIRKANNLPGGSEERIVFQKEADEYLEQIKDLVGVVGKLINCGVKKEAQIELSIENLQIPLHNWMERDEKIALSHSEEQMRICSWKLLEAKKNYEAVEQYRKMKEDTEIITAHDESLSRYRIAANEYKNAVEKYDMSMKRLMGTQAKFHKDDSTLCKVLDDIRKNTNIYVPNFDWTQTNNFSEQEISEKKQVTHQANVYLVNENKEIYSESTIHKLMEE